MAGPRSRHFLLRRWCRVLRSNLRCFFFAMRLRRFLITEPIGPSIVIHKLNAVMMVHDSYGLGYLERYNPTILPAYSTLTFIGPLRKAGIDDVTHCSLGHSEAAADAKSRQFTLVNQAVDSHFGHTHEICHFRNRHKTGRR